MTTIRGETSLIPSDVITLPTRILHDIASDYRQKTSPDNAWLISAFEVSIIDASQDRDDGQKTNKRRFSSTNDTEAPVSFEKNTDCWGGGEVLGRGLWFSQQLIVSIVRDQSKRFRSPRRRTRTERSVARVPWERGFREFRNFSGQIDG